MTERSQDAGALADAIAQLARTAQALSAAIEGQPEFVLHHKPGPADWCVTEILGHLLDTEREAVTPNLAAILTHDDPALVSFDGDAMVATASYHLANASDLVIAFDERRTETVAMLHRLTLAQWQRTAHDTAGHIYTLAMLTEGVAAHDREHLEQMATTLRHTPGRNV